VNIIIRGLSNIRKIVIGNQRDKSNHDHLGKVVLARLVLEHQLSFGFVFQ